MKPPTLACDDRRRREAVRQARAQRARLPRGERRPAHADASTSSARRPRRRRATATCCIEGGRRIRDIRVVGVTPHCRDGPRRWTTGWTSSSTGSGDFSTYTAAHGRARPATAGPPTSRCAGSIRRYARVAFSFKAGCPSRPRLRRDGSVSDARAADEPEIDYLAKDYARFRQLMLDRLAVADARVARAPRARPGHRPGRAAGLRRRPSQLLPGRGGHRGLPRAPRGSASPSAATPGWSTTGCTRAATPAPGSASRPMGISRSRRSSAGSSPGTTARPQAIDP